MVEVLLAAVILLTGLTLVNLLLVLGVVRRLREHDARLAQAAAGPAALVTAQVGQRVAQVRTQALDGTAVTVPSGEPMLLGFFSPSCEACHERVGDFRAAAGATPGAVAVVVRDGGDPDPLVNELTGLTVVLEELGGPVSGALGVQGFPAFARLEGDGTLLAHGFELPLPQPA